MRPPITGTPDEWLEWIRSDDPERRRDATLILGGLTPDDNVSAASLVGHLQDADSDVVFWAVIGLACLGHRAAQAVPALIQVGTRHPQDGVRQAALEALPRISPADLAAKNALLYTLRDSSHWVRQTALRALIDMTALDSVDLDAIRALESDQEPFVRHQLEITLRNIKLRTEQSNKSNDTVVP